MGRYWVLSGCFKFPNEYKSNTAACSAVTTAAAAAIDDVTTPSRSPVSKRFGSGKSSYCSIPTSNTFPNDAAATISTSTATKARKQWFRVSFKSTHTLRSNCSSFQYSNFDFKATLGVGNFSQVYLVQHKENGKNFALKVLKKQNLISLDQSANVKSEKELLFRIDHPNIVKLYATSSDKENLYFLLEFEPGGDLRQHLLDVGKFRENKVRFYIGCAILALEYLHSRNIAHRDLKPENLLIAPNGYLKLADFGFAKALDHTRTRTRCGTPGYMAPEVLLAQQPYGLEADWWSLGVVMFELLFGSHPFLINKNSNLMCRNIVQGNFHFPNHSCPIARDLISSLLMVPLNYRLGTSNGAKQVKSHYWFCEFNWDALASGKMPAPFIPELNDSDTSNVQLLTPSGFVCDKVLHSSSDVDISVVGEVEDDIFEAF